MFCFCPFPLPSPPIVHAAVIAINEAVDKQDVEGTFKALQNPNATLKNLKGDNREDYQNVLYAAKQSKEVTTLNKVKRQFNVIGHYLHLTLESSIC